MRMRELVNVLAVVVICAPSSTYAHGDRPGHIDEQGASLPTWITIVMVVSWIAIALGVVFFVRRLIRTGGSKAHVGTDRKSHNSLFGSDSQADTPLL
jgi:phosphate/sulfate permease